jgi:tRNA threonylcarbamoyladenosine biosynthesis protein TsaE
VAERSSLRRAVESSAPEQTRALGIRLGQVAESGDLFLLEGEFGTGKTVFVQGLAEGLGVATHVTSPSFVIINWHDGRLRLHHVDLYRAERLDPELEDTVADAIEAPGVTAIEWPQLLPSDLRAGASVVRFVRTGEQTRRIELETTEPRLATAFGTEREPDAAGH